ncbi:MAG: hypothetical protein KDE27_26815 [Planctomycetes bacterium]|nr:hypothetical protein [Planctomycetota bacterium]
MARPRSVGRLLALAGLAALTACGSVPTRTFTVDVIDSGEKPVPCLVVVGADWADAAQRDQIVNVAGRDTLAVTVRFDKPEVDLFAAAVPLDAATGKPRVVPKTRNESTELTGFVAGTRRLRANDPEKVLFILRSR